MKKYTIYLIALSMYCSSCCASTLYEKVIDLVQKAQRQRKRARDQESQRTISNKGYRPTSPSRLEKARAQDAAHKLLGKPRSRW